MIWTHPQNVENLLTALVESLFPSESARLSG